MAKLERYDLTRHQERRKLACLLAMSKLGHSINILTKAATANLRSSWLPEKTFMKAAPIKGLIRGLTVEVRFH